MLEKMIHGNIWNLTILGVDVYHIASWLIIFSFFGWVWETCLVSCRSHKYVNRGFIAGPFCTIYGVGAVSVYLILRPLGQNYVAVFFVGILVATVLEYVTSAVMERLFHAKWWDYSQHKFNIKGRICLGVSIGWGFMSLALFLIFMPAADLIMSLYPVIAGEIGICVFLVAYTIDFSLAAVAAFNLEEKFAEMQNSLDELGEKLRESKPIEKLEDALEEAKDALEGAKEELGERTEALRNLQISQKLEAAKAEWIKNQDKMSKRFIRSYPMLGQSMAEKRREFTQKKNELKRKINEYK